MSGDTAWCINCGASTPELYRRYSDSVLKLVKCPKCGHIADKYVEYEPVIVLIDLVLLSKEACRHILLNGDFKCHWKLAFLISLIEAYRSHSARKTPEPASEATMRLTETFDLIDAGYCVYLTYIHSLLSCLVFVLVVLALSLMAVPARPAKMLIWKSVVLGGCSIFLMIPALICGNTHHYWGLVVAYWFIAQVYVHHVVSGTSRIMSALIILAGVLAKCYLGLPLRTLAPACFD